MPYTREEIYEYKGWTLLLTNYGGIKQIEWGDHTNCGSCFFVYKVGFRCNNCYEQIPNDVYLHLRDAMELLQSTLCSPD